jgi:hypothetical protein
MSDSPTTPRYDEGFVLGRDYEDREENGVLYRALTPRGRDDLATAIELYGPPREWTPVLAEFIKQNGIPETVLPGKGSLGFVFPNILAGHPEYAFKREDLEGILHGVLRWYEAHPEVRPRPHRSTGRGSDVIQHVNKTGQWGLMHQAVGTRNTPHYMLRAPFGFAAGARRLITATPISTENRTAAVAVIKDRVRQEWLDVPEEEWDVGHARPGDPTSLVYQPRSYQRSRRDRFIFDELGMVKCPTAQELATHLDQYYTPEEQAVLRDALSQKFGETPR